MGAYASKHHLKSLTRRGWERIGVKKNLRGVRDRLVAWYHMKSFSKPSLRRMQRMAVDRIHRQNQFVYSSRYSTLTRILSVYKRMASRSKMKKIYLALRNKVTTKLLTLFSLHFDHQLLFVHGLTFTHTKCKHM